MVPSKIVLRWGQVMDDETGMPIRGAAIQALESYAGIVVLDILIMARDRINKRNHLFAMDREEWFSIDYWQSFELAGEDSFLAPYREGHRGPLIDAVRNNPFAIEHTVERVLSLDDDSIDALFTQVGAPFATPMQKSQMSALLKKRRSSIRDLVNDWRDWRAFSKGEQ
jgi:hypothetical protein